MKIGILGAGNIGATLARKLSAAGHTVLLANSRGPDTIADLAGEAGATAVPVAEAVKDVDVIIMSIPLGKIPSLKELLAEVPADVAVADTSNYYPTGTAASRRSTTARPKASGCRNRSVGPW
jgi:hypothetical protein